MPSNCPCERCPYTKICQDKEQDCAAMRNWCNLITYTKAQRASAFKPIAGSTKQMKPTSTEVSVAPSISMKTIRSLIANELKQVQSETESQAKQIKQLEDRVKAIAYTTPVQEQPAKRFTKNESREVASRLRIEELTEEIKRMEAVHTKSVPASDKEIRRLKQAIDESFSGWCFTDTQAVQTSNILRHAFCVQKIEHIPSNMIEKAINICKEIQSANFVFLCAVCDLRSEYVKSLTSSTPWTPSLKRKYKALYGTKVDEAVVSWKRIQHAISKK